MPNRTIWEEGHHPGRLVVRASALALVALAVLHVAVGAELGLIFDVAFVAICGGAALWVRPRDFFMVGVLPPLLLGGIVVLLTILDRAAVARASDGFVQAFVSGLAHHSLALAIGYALTLGVLALRQVALRNRGSLRRTPVAHKVEAARPPATSIPAESTDPTASPRDTATSRPAVPAQHHATLPGGESVATEMPTGPVATQSPAAPQVPTQRDALAP